ncbi:GPW/gp25 family protein [Mesorhizobium prunaredense]|uniref:GPW/gp25 family protein n=1 Tax=Mesorhizobium prunaredense TaxID=1631249 RepID=A0A1R3VID1_9HYPH|nr:GPW/gp25 family protein [Mesorhizobium prunaredense]SIT58622.1 GPW/gp25 family protein [Mesorhizobium prunaredense]
MTVAGNQTRAFLGNGFGFPPMVNARGGFDWIAGEANVQRAIWIILSTARGEMQLNPRFGCGIHDYVFTDNTPANRASIAHQVRMALLEWEMRIDLIDIRVVEGESPSTLLIEIDYRLKASHALGNLVYPFYVGEQQGE